MRTQSSLRRLHIHTYSAVILALISVSCAEHEVPSSPAGMTSIQPSLQAASRDSVAEDIRDRYIVTFKPDPSRDIATASASLVNSEAGSLGMVYRHAMQGFSARLSPEAAKRIQNRPDIAFIEPVTDADVLATVQTPTPSWGLDRIDQFVLPLDSRFVYGKTGTGVHSYHLDSGILYSHADFGGRAVLGADFVTTGGNGVDCYGHGTATALVAGGATYGVAKGLSLVGVKIVDCLGNVRNREILMAAIDWVTANAIKPAVANWSISGPYSAQFNLAFANSVASGITWVAAAGNENSSACNYSPAVVPALLTVAASTAADARWVATSDTASNYGSCVDLFAPGKDIIAPWLGGPALTSGTSLAAPHVTGAAALYLEGHPNDTPAQVASAILGAAYPYAILNPGAGTTGRLLNIAFTYPSPASLTVSISGKSSIKPDQTCTWKAAVQGGTGTLQYRWAFAGQDIHLSLVDSITTIIPNSGALTVQVSSFGGTEIGSASKTITVSPSGQSCLT